MHKTVLAAVGVVLAAGLAGAQPAGAGPSTSTQVVVQRGQSVQLALVLDSTGVGQPFEQGIHNAVQMAVEQHPSIRGFRVQINDYTGPCFDPANPLVDQRDANVAAANAVVANTQNVGVIGHECSSPFGEPRPPDTTALEIYQSHGIVAINGSTTAGYLPAVGPTVFDRTAVADPGFDAWYAQVRALPGEQLWQQAYESEFGAAPTDFADLYYDAASLLLRRLQDVATVAGGKLVIDRAALAAAVRSTTGFEGVSCTVTLDPATGNRVDDPAALAACKNRLVVPRGQPVQFTFTADSAEVPGFSTAFTNAIRMAVERHPTIRGFAVQVNSVETACGGDNTTSATAIVANTQNTAVLGDLCSPGFASALPIYQAAGVVAISGSATSADLPGTLGPTVFDRTAVADPDFDAWYAQVQSLSSDQLWRQEYLSEFGVTPTDFADLYYDAASLLLRRLQSVSAIVKGNLVIDRAALAKAVRDTTDFRGVTCTVAFDPLTGDRVNDSAALRRCGRN